MTVQPFDAALGLPDAFARRIARNTQSLLVEEAGIARVADPAGGSWYVEHLTDDLADHRLGPVPADREARRAGDRGSRLSAARQAAGPRTSPAAGTPSPG